MAQSPKPNLHRLDPVWERIRREAEQALDAEPLLGGMFHASVLHHKTLEQALAFRLSQKLSTAELSEQILREIMDAAHADDPSLGEAARADIVATYERDPGLQPVPETADVFQGVSGGSGLSHLALAVPSGAQ